MLKQETMIKLRNRGAATVAGLYTFALSGSAALAQDAVTGLNESVSTENQTTIFEDGGIFQRVTNTLLFLVGAISVIMLIVGGIRYIVSAGDQNQVTGAKNTIMYAIVGIIVAVMAWGIVNFVLTKRELYLGVERRLVAKRILLNDGCQCLSGCLLPCTGRLSIDTARTACERKHHHQSRCSAHAASSVIDTRWG